MKNHLFNELIENGYLDIDYNSTSITKQSQKKGSPLDRYQSEILFFRYEMGCSYSDIAKWLLTYKNVQRSHTQVAFKIQQWGK
ncbi:hypothetical protein [Vibrio sp. TBV020]|uniref:hypothetical protein n=1 Tax=Vibrio sp. TBV020 TaxID=3137398 RepID=UPI0038CD7E46